MMKMTMTAHVVNDRMDRVLAIAQHVGWGTEMICVHEAHKLEVLTTTGVLLVKSMDNKLITAYVPSIDKVRVMYSILGYDHIPTNVCHRVKKSIKAMKQVGLY